MASLAGLLVRGDFYPDEAIAAYAWPLIIQAGGLGELAGTRLQLTARGRKALSAPPHGTVRDLWRTWVSSGVIDEFSRIESIKGQRSTNVPSSVSTRRRTVAAALGSLPAGTCIMRHGEWSPKPYRVDLVSGELNSVGSRYRSVGWVPPNDANHTNDVEITEVVPMSHFALSATDETGTFASARLV